MKYMCLRNCYVGERLWKEGRVYSLPDSMEKHPKNFRLVGEPEPTVSDAPEQPRQLKPGEYLCSKCTSIHRETSKLGQKHLKNKEANSETKL